MPSRSRSLSRGRDPSRSPYSDASGHSRRDSRSASRPRRSITPRSPSRSPRRNERYRSASRGARDRSLSPLRSTKVVVEKLTKNVNEDHLREIFSPFGEIRDMDMPMNRQFMTNRGTAYILYALEADADAAISHMHESQLDGVNINVSIVVPRRKFSPAPPVARRGANFDPRNPPPNNARGPAPSRRRSPLPPQNYNRSTRDMGRGRDFGRDGGSYRARSMSRSRSPRRHRSRSRSISTRSRSPPRRHGGGGSGSGRLDNKARGGGRRRRSPSYSSYSSYDERDRNRSISRSRDRGGRSRR